MEQEYALKIEELAKGKVVYNEHGETLIVDLYIDGQDWCIVVPVYEGVSMYAHGDGGYHQEVSTEYEHEGMPVRYLLKNLYSDGAPEKRICENISLKKKELDDISLIIGRAYVTKKELEKKIRDREKSFIEMVSELDRREKEIRDKVESLIITINEI